MVGAVVVRKVSKGFYGRYGPTRNFYSLLAPARTHYGQLPETCWGQIALRSHPLATFGAIFAAVPSITQISLFLNFPPPFPLTAYDGIACFCHPTMAANGSLREFLPHHCVCDFSHSSND
jgi:hypothetical protein